MRKLLGLSALAIWCLGAPVVAQAQQRMSGEVLARELYFEERGPNRRALWTADAMIARWPSILRALRAEGVAAVRLGADCAEQLPCHRTISDEYIYSGSRLLSVFSTTDQFMGGAHGSVVVSDYIYDLRSGRRIRFGDLFTSWSRAQALLRPKLCEALRAIRGEMEGVECPGAGDVAYGLAETSEIPVGGPATGFEVRMGDYALGSYAAGRETLFVMLDRPLYNLIKPEYRADFRVAD